MRRVFAVITTDPEAAVRRLANLPAEVAAQLRGVEVRADLVGDVDPGWLRRHCRGELLYTLRSRAQGGSSDEPEPGRRARLLAAARGYDLVDVEGEHDLDGGLAEAIPPARRVLSWCPAESDLPTLRRRLAEMAGTGAALIRLAPGATTVTQALAPLRLLAEQPRPDVIAYARGLSFAWTRILALRLGAPALFASADGPPAPPGGPAPVPEAELAVGDLAGYHLTGLDEVVEVYGLFGNAAHRSLAPRLHNAGYRELGLPARYLPFPALNLAETLPELRRGLDELGLPLRGCTVGPPYKEAALMLAESASPLARRCGSASLLTRKGDGWWGDVEARGVVATLAARGVVVSGLSVAVVGCGGGGRAAAVGLARAGAEVTLVNRGSSRARTAAGRIGLPHLPLAEFSPAPYGLVVNATPVVDELPFRIDGLLPGAVVFDLAYRQSGDTALIQAAREAGHLTIDGREMSMIESSRQFALMTRRRLPAGVARSVFSPVAPSAGRRRRQAAGAGGRGHGGGRRVWRRPLDAPAGGRPGGAESQLVHTLTDRTKS